MRRPGDFKPRRGRTTAVAQVLAYSNITSRPGFGGIFVENDQ
jgi:hypothetical protein